MALTELQRSVCRLIARQRIESGESYIAGGSALGEFTASPRISRDIDVFHDSHEAVNASYKVHHRILQEQGFRLEVRREFDGFVEVWAWKDADKVEVQWGSDSAYRYFPLVEHVDFGLTLHPFDLATNKVLALVGRVEPRDWLDIKCSRRHVKSSNGFLPSTRASV